jgi:hypothetical protein
MHLILGDERGNISVATSCLFNVDFIIGSIFTAFTVLWRIGPLLRSDSVNNSRCYGTPAAYACAVTSHSNRRGDVGGVLCRPALRLYNSSDCVLLSE